MSPPMLPYLPQTRVCRYLTPLREGGSLPAIVESEDRQLWVAKWRGAGQGATALVAEVIAGELARVLGLPIPALVSLTLDEQLARTERDQEIRDLLVASVGLNLGMSYKSGALTYDPAVTSTVSPSLAARIVVFDAYVMNVDRSARNTNLLWHDDGLWLIDHGAALYWHHGWDGTIERPARPFPQIADHVLLACASDLEPAARELQAMITDEVLERVIHAVPPSWLAHPTRRRRAYMEFLAARRDEAAPWIEEAQRARTRL